jgi:hypothetical protein
MNKTKTATCGIIAALLISGVMAFAACSPEPPESAKNLTANPAGLHSISAEWEAGKGADLYIAEIRELPAASDPADTGVPGDSAEVTETSYLFDGLKADTEYEVSVTAVKGEGAMGLMGVPATVTAKTSAPEIAAPAGLAATAISDTEITISWDAVEITDEDGTTARDSSALPSTPEASYTLFVSDKEDGTYTILAENLTETKYAHADLSAETTKAYTVKATLALDGKTFESPASEPAIATTNEAPSSEQTTENGNSSGKTPDGSSSGSSGSKASSGSQPAPGGSPGSQPAAGSSGSASNAPASPDTNAPATEPEQGSSGGHAITQKLDVIFWIAGAWGYLAEYPFTGTIGQIEEKYEEIEEMRNQVLLDYRHSLTPEELFYNHDNNVSMNVKYGYYFKDGPSNVPPFDQI